MIRYYSIGIIYRCFVKQQNKMTPKDFKGKNHHIGTKKPPKLCHALVGVRLLGLTQLTVPRGSCILRHQGVKGHLSGFPKKSAGNEFTSSTGDVRQPGETWKSGGWGFLFDSTNSQPKGIMHAILGTMMDNEEQGLPVWMSNKQKQVEAKNVMNLQCDQPQIHKFHKQLSLRFPIEMMKKKTR